MVTQMALLQNNEKKYINFLKILICCQKTPFTSKFFQTNFKNKNFFKKT